jgi:hypothetical protein
VTWACVRHGAGAAGDVILSNRDRSGEEGWSCTELANVTETEKALYWAGRIFVTLLEL